MRTTCKNKENKKKHFSTLSIDDMKTKTKIQICFVGKKNKILGNSQNITTFTQQA